MACAKSVLAFHFYCANVPINVPMCQRRANFSTSTIFENNFSIFEFFKAQNLSSRTKNLNCDICKMSWIKCKINFIVVKVLTFLRKKFLSKSSKNIFSFYGTIKKFWINSLGFFNGARGISQTIIRLI